MDSLNVLVILALATVMFSVFQCTEKSLSVAYLTQCLRSNKLQNTDKNVSCTIIFRDNGRIVDVLHCLVQSKSLS